jgi:hypothetical protein
MSNNTNPFPTELLAVPSIFKADYAILLSRRNRFSTKFPTIHRSPSDPLSIISGAMKYKQYYPLTLDYFIRRSSKALYSARSKYSP